MEGIINSSDESNVTTIQAINKTSSDTAAGVLIFVFCVAAILTESIKLKNQGRFKTKIDAVTYPAILPESNIAFNLL